MCNAQRSYRQHTYSTYTKWLKMLNKPKIHVTCQGRVHKHVKSHRGNEPRLPLRPPSAMRPSSKQRSVSSTRSPPPLTRVSRVSSTALGVVKMSLNADIPSVLRVGGFDCRVWYRRQPVLCSICAKAGHRPKQCPFNGLCKRCRKPGHMARECRSAWGTAERSAAPGPSAPRVTIPPSAPPPVSSVTAPSAPPVPRLVPSGWRTGKTGWWESIAVLPLPVRFQFLLSRWPSPRRGTMFASPIPIVRSGRTSFNGRKSGP